MVGAASPVLPQQSVQAQSAIAQQLFALPSDIRPQDGCSQDYDLAETAALIATLDLVITTDTCIAHLAGAMAKPVWILLPHLSDWRWMQNRETTPWYPTARLFRQTTPGDWSAVLTRVAEELATLHPHPSAFMQSRTHAQRDIPAGAA